MFKKSFKLGAAVLALIILSAPFVQGQWLRNKLKQVLIDRIDKKAEQQFVLSTLFTMHHDGRERSYYVYKPTSWDNQTPIPLVFLFHGGGGGARGALYYYELEKKAEEAGFLLVAPNGTGEAEHVLLTWNVFLGFGYAQKNNVDDMGFIKSLLKELEKKYAIDPRRIYATGLSNGAFLCHFLAAQPENRFAAIAPVVGSAGGREVGAKDWIKPPEPKTPVSVCIIQGLIDKHVPVYGGAQQESVAAAKEVLSASATIDFWVQANACAPTASGTYLKEMNSTLYEYGNGRNNTEVKAYIIHDMGHAWPGSTRVPRRGSDKPSSRFPGNDIIWEFFKTHPRPE